MKLVAANFSGVGREAFPPPFLGHPPRLLPVLAARGGGARNAGGEATPLSLEESPPRVGFPVGRSG